ncbi:MAG: tRNA (N6-threonylcarbamoyladenosine(37)-N6)-methyltransferase TrmO [Bacteroidota bacterium]|nr:tRNA (N6-threonylcarbamoyladenosine(37)-N6)-methyltransferase TrmO [Bacteroidota bacterium]
MKKLLLPIIFLTLITGLQAQTISYTPIGYFHTPYTTETGAPRQGSLSPDSTGYIVLDSVYREALTMLNWFEYIIVLYHFDKVRSWESFVEPPGSNHEHNFGLFSTRSPKRPNPIGFTIVKLDHITVDTLFLSGIDAFDGTPVLDIKPYMPSVDMIKSMQNEIIEIEFGHHDEDFIYDSTFYR